MTFSSLPMSAQQMLGRPKTRDMTGMVEVVLAHFMPHAGTDCGPFVQALAATSRSRDSNPSPFTAACASGTRTSLSW